MEVKIFFWVSYLLSQLCSSRMAEKIRKIRRKIKLSFLHVRLKDRKVLLQQFVLSVINFAKFSEKS